MHMRITYLFLADLHITRHARQTESEKYILNILTNLVELILLQVKIVIIDPKSYQSTHFLYAIENSPMDFSRKSQTSTNTSEFEESVEVRNDTKS